jgi:hypothetical protein
MDGRRSGGHAPYGLLIRVLVFVALAVVLVALASGAVMRLGRVF